MNLWIEGQAVTVPPGCSVAAALGRAAARISVGGQPRAPLCGMGVCQECRVSVDGQRRLACQTLCVDGMRVEVLR
jgi:succinate dehydrogenase/fumarate reductase-like Fe-S protein